MGCQTAHFVHRGLQGQQTHVSDVVGQHPGKTARAPGMSVLEATVGADIGMGPGEQGGNILLRHAGSNNHVPGLTGPCLVVDRGLGQIGKRLAGGHGPNLGNFSQGFAHQPGIGFIQGKDDALGGRQFRHHRIYGPHVSRVPLRQQHHHVGLPEGVGVDVGSNVDALVPCCIEPVQQFRRAAPKTGHGQLQVG